MGGAVSPAMAPARRAMALDQQTATFVLVGTLLYTGSVPWLIARWDSTMTVRAAIRMRPHF